FPSRASSTAAGSSSSPTPDSLRAPIASRSAAPGPRAERAPPTISRSRCGPRPDRSEIGRPPPLFERTAKRDPVIPEFARAPRTPTGGDMASPIRFAPLLLLLLAAAVLLPAAKAVTATRNDTASAEGREALRLIEEDPFYARVPQAGGIAVVSLASRRSYWS